MSDRRTGELQITFNMIFTRDKKNKYQNAFAIHTRVHAPK